GYQFYLRPLRSADGRLLTLSDELAKQQKAFDELQAAQPRLKQMKRISLPADPDLAQREYLDELNRMLRNSEFPVESIVITPKPRDTRAANVPPSKRLPYTTLRFDVDAQGELMSLVDFLDRFYRTPLLHRIRTMSVQRPVTVTPQQRQNELKINLTIEALIVDGAEKRETLLPRDLKDAEKPKREARTTAQYASIAG